MKFYSEVVLSIKSWWVVACGKLAQNLLNMTIICLIKILLASTALVMN